ncbi:MAG: SDR family oxidoreductase [Bacteroidia bacterium]|nr:SDR family oxidoreductase [Bacteroidia bacterium]
MRVLLTGVTGYIGRRLLPVLVQRGYHVICPVRDPRRFDYEDFDEDFMRQVEIWEVDLNRPETLRDLPKDIDVAYYLVHGMTSSYEGFSELENQMAQNFADYVRQSTARQVIYLSGIVNKEHLSAHLKSRLHTEEILKVSGIPLTVLRAAIIIGSGSASFEIIRDLVEKLPLMVAPRWVNTRCQPIAIRNVIQYLEAVLGCEASYGQVYDIGGPDVLTYKQMLQGFAEVRGLNRPILTIPVLTPKLSSYWLYFVTSTSFNLARSLVDSMHIDVVCQRLGIQQIISLELFTYKEALLLAFQKIAQNEVISSWKDTINGPVEERFLDSIKVPRHGCLTDRRSYSFRRDPEVVLDNIWSIGGERGWYYANFLWKVRGFLDKVVGGVGLRRGRRSQIDLKPGDALDFWRVLLADRKNRRLLLYAEMKLPGEAWLEFSIKPQEDSGEYILYQNATFRPRGIWGRLYWYSVLPFHVLIFPGMAKAILKYQPTQTVERQNQQF